MKKYLHKIFILLAILIFSGCSSYSSRNLTTLDKEILISTKSQLQTRQLQTKRFFNTNKTEVIKALIKVLQDESYFITVINYDTGVISAKGTKNNLDFNLVSFIEDKIDNNVDVRISLNLISNNYIGQKEDIIRKESLYKYFFSKLNKSLFLEQQLYNKTVDTNKSLIQKPIYSIQIISSNNKEYAQDYLNKLKQYYKNVRLVRIKNYYTVRIGKFTDINKARKLLPSVVKNYSDALVLRTL